MPSLLSPKPRTPHQRSQDARTASPSYFGIAVNPDQTHGNSSSLRGVKPSFTPSSASIRSVAATPPQDLSLHSNPDYDAFRKRAEQNAFSLNQGSVSQFSTPPLPRQNSRPAPSRTTSRQTPMSPKIKTSPPSIQRLESTGQNATAQRIKSPKRLLSNESQMLLDDRPRRESPASFLEANGDTNDEAPKPPTRHDERNSRSTLPSGFLQNPPTLNHHRAETLPEKFEVGTPNLASAQHIVTILDAYEEEVLLLDLRVSTQYGRSHISGALNLCVPTTLLKRPSYNVQRLADTFKDQEQRTKFECWENCKCIVVYDANSAQLQEAAICLNILKKFSSEGWEGDSYIIKGGFDDFARKFPSRVAQGAAPSPGMTIPSLTLRTNDNPIPPVIGGCPMPATKNAANPFFGNIRQNMDLIGGVGQMSIKHPSEMMEERRYEIPAWLKSASSEKDNGKIVADKFLQIEKREQKRMQEALSGHVTYGTPSHGGPTKIRIAGIEKGSKNRYNNIWPYEHSRVKLQDVPRNECDYINANDISTSFSRKRYIATQGPIPTTFTDFWTMVWQSKVRVIVMLTAESEGGQVKAHNYWNERHYGTFKLNFLSEHRASLDISKIKRHRTRPGLGERRSTTDASHFRSRNSNSSSNSDYFAATSKTDAHVETEATPHVTVRKFTLSHEGQPFERMREITQLQYSNWPDFGAPAHPAHLLGLVEQCSRVVRSTRTNSFRRNMDGSLPDDDEEMQSPVLVHCSAGCGRTGTFCTVDTVVDMLKQQQRARTAAQLYGGQSRMRDATPMDIDDDNHHSDITGSAKPSQSADMDFFSQGQVGGDDEMQRDTEDDWLYHDDMDLIERVVEELRLQRLSMVQSLRQYCLTYEAVLEWIVNQQNAGGGE